MLGSVTSVTGEKLGREYTAPLGGDSFAKHTALRTRTQHLMRRRLR